MDLVAGYSSSGSDDSDEGSGGGDAETTNNPLPPPPPPPPPAPVVRRPDRRALNAAPTPSLVATHSLVAVGGGGERPKQPPGPATGTGTGGGQVMLMNNPLKSELLRPVQGPAMADPTGPKPTSRGVVGAQETNYAFDEVTFDTQRKQFQQSGRALGPDVRGTAIQTNPAHYRRAGGATTNSALANKKRRLMSSTDERTTLVQTSDDEATYGIWGPPSAAELELRQDATTDLAAGAVLQPEQIAERAHLAEKARRRGQVDDNDQQQFDKLVERKMSHLLPPRMQEEEPVAVEPTTKFHGSDDEEYDYRGRSWVAPPSGVHPLSEEDMDDHKCYVPKKCVHRFTGHNKGVHRIRLFPGTGHLLLSAGLEGKCKVWSIAKRKCMRTYIGHTAAVRDVQFSNTGEKFISASFDRFLRLWNTETGEVLGTYTNRRVPYVVKFYPKDDNTFVVGCSDNKIVAYDSTSGEITQEYNHHLAPVNTITFCEDATKMVTSSDDKKVLVWEWDIGVPIKYISDPGMHSMPCIVRHPSDMFWAGQSLDNQIVVYQARDRFALQRKKKFVGHTVAGYACDMAFSPDGQFIASGDGEGKVYFWEWKRQKLLQKYRAHDNGPAIGCAWHPVEPSTFFSCGWDGVIKMWQ